MKSILENIDNKIKLEKFSNDRIINTIIKNTLDNIIDPTISNPNLEIYLNSSNKPQKINDKYLKTIYET